MVGCGAVRIWVLRRNALRRRHRIADYGRQAAVPRRRDE